MKNIKLIILTLCGCLTIQTIFSQAPSKAQLQSKMNQFSSAVNKQIVDLEKQIADKKKNKADAETIRQLENQLAALKSQLKMIGDVSKGVSNVSDQALQQSRENENIVVPKKDLARINMIPKKLLNTAELLIYLKNVHASVDKLIPLQEKQDALQEYNETNAKYKSTVITANAANGFWMMGHWEKALFIMGKVCIDDVTDADNLNNYAAFLIMTGAEQAAIPILDYLNNLFPENSTIMNNLGQAWFGLGDLDNAKKNLNNATGMYANHSTANETLSRISQSEGDDAKTISFLKASLKEAYDPDKEQQLERMGYTIKFEDLPPLNFPMQNDPLGFLPLLNSLPATIQTDVTDDSKYYELKRYLNGVENLRREIADENLVVAEKLSARNQKLAADKEYREEYMEYYNYSPAYWLALRGRQLICNEYDGVCKKEFQSSSPFMTSLLLPTTDPFEDTRPLTVSKMIEECRKIYFEEVLDPIQRLVEAMAASTNGGCDNYVQHMNAYLGQYKEIYVNGFTKIKNQFVAKSKRLNTWIRYTVYSALDDRILESDEMTRDFVDYLQKNLEGRRSANIEYSKVLDELNWSIDFLNWYQKECGGNERPNPNPGAVNLGHLKPRSLPCQFIKKVETDSYSFEFVCNGIKEKKDSKYKKRKTEIQKGSVQSSRPRSGNINTPLQPTSRRGPNEFSALPPDMRSNFSAPLNAEDKDLSQFSITYDRWGNLISLDLQLNEDGTALLDATSVESGKDSRWSWNAIASPKKGPLNKLITK